MGKFLGDLLLNCLRHDPDPVAAPQLSQLEDEQWQALIFLAKKQRVAPLLYYRLKSTGLAQTIPESALSELKSLYRRNAMRNLRMMAGLNRIAVALQKKSIPVIALKGAHLALAVYPDPVLREMNDIDLLVPSEKLALAGKVLESEGYKAMAPYKVYFEGADFHHLPRFLKPNALPIEVHWTITPPDSPCAIAIDELWDRAIPFTVAGVNILALSPEDALLHSCFHTSFQHQFQMGLRPSCDIAAIIRHSGDAFNWEVVLRRAMDWRWHKGVYLALRLAEDLVGAVVPQGVLQQMQPSDLNKEIVEMAQAQIVTDIVSEITLTPEAATVFNRKGFVSKLAGMAGRIFIPKKMIAMIYSLPPDSWRTFLYYPVRLKDLIVRYCDVMQRLLKGEQDAILLTRRKAIISDWLGKG